MQIAKFPDHSKSLNQQINTKVATPLGQVIPNQKPPPILTPSTRSFLRAGRPIKPSTLFILRLFFRDANPPPLTPSERVNTHLRPSPLSSSTLIESSRSVRHHRFQGTYVQSDSRRKAAYNETKRNKSSSLQLSSACTRDGNLFFGLSTIHKTDAAS